MTPLDQGPPDTAALTPLVRQLTSQLRASRGKAGIVHGLAAEPAAPAVLIEPKSARIDLRATLDVVAEASKRSRTLVDGAAELEKRLTDALGKLARAEAALGEARDEIRRERIRADEHGRRSAELLDQTQAMLTDAGNRLESAEARANAAETDLAYLKRVIKERLG